MMIVPRCFLFLARGATQGYAPQSGEIVGILKQLMAAQKEEEDRKANHAEIVAAKEDIATLTATIEKKLARQGDLEVEVESLKNDVADMQRSLTADQELAVKLAESCSSLSSEWEERQESRLGEGALCARRRSRKTVACHCLCVVEPVYIRPCCAADGRIEEESFAAGPALTGHICSISFCLYVPTERDKYVWLVQSRRRPEKWTRIWRAGSRGSATPDPVPDHVLCLGNTITSRRWWASSPSRSSPTPASLVKTRSRHTSLCRFSFGVSAIQNGSMYVLGMRQQRTGESVDRGPVSFCDRFCVKPFVTRRARTAAGRRGAGLVLGVGGAQEEQGWERLGL